MDDGVAVEVVEIGGDAVFEFGLGCDADMAEHRAGHFGKEALNQVEPRAVFRGEYEAKAFHRLGREPGPGFFGDVGRMIVEDQFDGGLRWIGGIELLKKSDEFARAVAVFDAGVHTTGEQVDASQQTERAMAFVFVDMRCRQITSLIVAVLHKR